VVGTRGEAGIQHPPVERLDHLRDPRVLQRVARDRAVEHVERRDIQRHRVDETHRSERDLGGEEEPVVRDELGGDPGALLERLGELLLERRIVAARELETGVVSAPRSSVGRRET